jgi:hypothetical protein
MPSPTTSGANDLPRITVSNPAGTVSIVWNDARQDPGGDIPLQSYTLALRSPDEYRLTRRCCVCSKM